MDFYTAEELATVKRLREKRRNAKANQERGLYTLLCEDEIKYHDAAFQRYLDFKVTGKRVIVQPGGETPITGDAELDNIVPGMATRTADPFGQPPDTSMTEADPEPLPTVGPATMAPWAVNGPAKLPEPVKVAAWATNALEPNPPKPPGYVDPPAERKIIGHARTTPEQAALIDFAKEIAPAVGSVAKPKAKLKATMKKR